MVILSDAFGSLEADGLFYFALNTTQSTNDESQKACNNFTNYTLALITSMTSFNISLKYCERCNEEEVKQISFKNRGKAMYFTYKAL
ncbi:hypothetical protein Avbf_17612 [Armadillidium vulgare]|nr:hypothetical protein Avbf_17612 [Armadillidium vulgare]